MVRGPNCVGVTLRAVESAMRYSDPGKGSMLYFFNQAGAVYNPDNEGFELASLSDARVEAVRFAASTLRDRPDLAWAGEEYRVEVTDADQLILFTFIAMGVDAPAANGKK